MKTALVACVVLSGCGSPIQPGPRFVPDPNPWRVPPEFAPPASPSLYSRLGGIQAIGALVDAFVNRVMNDPRIKDRFFDTDATTLKGRLAELVCSMSGGPCRYSGHDMPLAHAGMALVDDEFTALVEDLVGTLVKLHVDDREKTELLAAIEAIRPQIVVGPDKLSPIDEAQLAEVTAVHLEDLTAARLLRVAVLAGRRGQRSYAEQLFSRAELVVGVAPLAAIAPIFRGSAPPLDVTPLKPTVADAAPQPKRAGNSEDESDDHLPAGASLRGTLRVEGKPVAGLGVVTLSREAVPDTRIPAVRRVVEQRGTAFAPHITVVPAGSTIAFPNYDPQYHDVFSLSKPRSFDLGMYKNSTLREVKFDTPGVVRIGCNIHASMSAYIIVTDAGHYAVVDDAGTFVFHNLTPGTYRVRAWSELSAQPLITRFIVKPGQNQQTIDMPDGVSPGPGPDKFGTSRSSDTILR